MQLILFFTDISSQIVILKWLHFYWKWYESLFHGSVVDMFQFPMFNWTWPSWLPFVGGEDFVFFEPVFNIADASISIAIFLIIINYKTFFLKTKNFLRCDTIV